MKKIKHNDLTHYFLRPHQELPQAYLASCEKFFKELSIKQQAASPKRQASSCKLDGWPDSCYSRIIKEN
jgi:hypothetical protein